MRVRPQPDIRRTIGGYRAGTGANDRDVWAELVSGFHPTVEPLHGRNPSRPRSTRLSRAFGEAGSLRFIGLPLRGDFDHARPLSLEGRRAIETARRGRRRSDHPVVATTDDWRGAAPQGDGRESLLFSR